MSPPDTLLYRGAVSPAPSLLLVDDEPEILESLRRTLRDEGYELLATTSCREAIELLDQRPIDIVVTDVRMPEMSGVELVTHVRRAHPSVMRILLTGFATLESAIAAINEGAVRRYLSKPWDNAELREQLRESVREVRATQAMSSGSARARATIDAADLSPRLRETAAALVTGASEKQIASELGVSTHTAHQYVKTLYRRFGVSSRAEFMVRMQDGTGHVAPVGKDE